jgi:hypothetical protein
MQQMGCFGSTTLNRGRSEMTCKARFRHQRKHGNMLKQCVLASRFQLAYPTMAKFGATLRTDSDGQRSGNMNSDFDKLQDPC